MVTEGFGVAQWVRLCGVGEAPAEGQVGEAQVEGVDVCLARIGGELSAVENRCPHRGGPLGQGWVEAQMVVCPWHAWSFDVKTGVGEFPAHKERIKVFPVQVAGEDVLVDMEAAGAGESSSEHLPSEQNFK